mmetsp:Transcript_17716/g.42688  ORF Transcript_17716/g.42688 Transcript_17716/m.42688 type:complete len:330 (+) Transcript_17716:128-1117(+)|eukprot:CAMPEP_0181088346 /NCGR_PEP_ID=MMETSP1071-20121207/6737_1 /TAXON_ID=35127 /ORGANISM="Thalassiosira sp., Strain NH16" /LENGTH=329 /DNA_ID=CAMNT_0023170255 /DNA_START=124 /DNA_END=1113 /DNA_ORIENTATION=+
MKGLLFFSFATSIPNNNDALFNAWCSDVGIECPGAEVRTTPDSVAGRGVFCTKDLSCGDEVISIPYYAALTQENGAGYFPSLARELSSARIQKSGQRSLLKRIWNRIFRGRSTQREELLAADAFWQAELTAYALAARQGDHPWSTWISQWKREDPFQDLVDASVWRHDVDAIEKAALDFQKMAPDISEHRVGAAIGIRLQELDEYSERYEKEKAPTSESMYATLISRAVGLSDNVTAILPMHDMINHSPDPNVALYFGEDGAFKLIATEDIPKDTEIFLTYMDIVDCEGKWDEDKATWLLVQWGIPSSPLKYSQVEDQASKEEYKLGLL